VHPLAAGVIPNFWKINTWFCCIWQRNDYTFPVTCCSYKAKMHRQPASIHGYYLMQEVKKRDLAP